MVSNQHIANTHTHTQILNTQAIFWTNAWILLIGSLGTNFSGFVIEIHTFWFKKMHLKMSYGEWRPVCLGLNVWNPFVSTTNIWTGTTRKTMRVYGPLTWWRHQMETFSALVAFSAGNSPVTGEFPAQRPLTRSFDVTLICTWTDSWANNADAGDWRRYRAHYDVIVMYT